MCFIIYFTLRSQPYFHSNQSGHQLNPSKFIVFLPILFHYSVKNLIKVHHFHNYFISFNFDQDTCQTLMSFFAIVLFLSFIISEITTLFLYLFLNNTSDHIFLHCYSITRLVIHNYIQHSSHWQDFLSHKLYYQFRLYIFISYFHIIQ